MTSSNSSEDNCGAASSLIFGAFTGAVDVDAGDDCDDEANAGHDDDEEGDEADDDNALGNGEGKPGRREVLFVPSPPLSPPPSAPPLHSPPPPFHSLLHPFILIPLIYPCVFSFSSLFSFYSSPSFASSSSVHSSTMK